MIRRLSGWARLWIVSAVLIWGAGAWWVLQQPRDYPQSAYPDPSECESDAYRTQCGHSLFPIPPPTSTPIYQSCAEIERDYNACVLRQGRLINRNRATYQARQAVLDRERLIRLASPWAILFSLPFVAGAIFWLLRIVALWVTRGFQGSGTPPPPSAGQP